MQMSLLVEELGDGDDVRSIVVHFKTSQIYIDISRFSSQLDLALKTAVTPIQKNNAIDSLNLNTNAKNDSIENF